MAFQTRDQFQDKASKKLDRVLNKKKKLATKNINYKYNGKKN